MVMLLCRRSCQVLSPTLLLQTWPKRGLTFCRPPQEGGAAQVDEGAVDEKIVFGRNLRTLEGGAPRLAQTVNLPADLLGNVRLG
jgi:hypothetical protein